MVNKILNTKKAPKAVGAYNQAIIAGDIVYISGQIGIDPATGELVSGLEEQTRQIMENLKNILQAQGLDFENVVKSEIFLNNIDNFSVVDEVYKSFFEDYFPARQTIGGLNLPKGALVEISMIATL